MNKKPISCVTRRRGQTCGFCRHPLSFWKCQESDCTQQFHLLTLSYFFVRRHRSQRKRLLLSSVLLAISGGSQIICQPYNNRRLLYSVVLQCNPLHLASKMVGKAFLLDSLKNVGQRYNDRFHGSLYLLTSCLIPAKTKTN